MSRRTSRGGPRPAAALLPKVTRTALRRRGFVEAEVITRWQSIVGATLAAHCLPEKLVFPRSDGGGVLHLRVASAAAPEIQHLTPLILDRINTFYGYLAVERLRLNQGPLPARSQTGRRPWTPLAPEERRALERSLAETDDPGLRAALLSLGEAVLGQEEEGQ